MTRAHTRLQKEVDRLPPEQRSNVSKAVQRLESVRQRQELILREDLQLYRTLASLGTTIAVFAHEAAKPVGQIRNMALSISRRAKEALGSAYPGVLEAPVTIVLQSARALESYASFPLALLRREKRRFGEVDIHSVTLDMVELFKPFLEDAYITCDVRLYDGRPMVGGSVAALESILSNLITNAVNAFTQQQQSQLERMILVKTEVTENTLLISVMDNGPGITGVSVEEIWLPGRTSTPGGTGLGLTIVEGLGCGYWRTGSCHCERTVRRCRDSCYTAANESGTMIREREKVALVDDDPIAAATLRVLLEDAGYEAVGVGPSARKH